MSTQKKQIITLVSGFLVIIAIISGAYYSLNKKIADIKSEQTQQNQNIRDLITFDWETYQYQNNDLKLYFYLKHPSTVFICQLKYPNNVLLFLTINHGETCEFAERAKDAQNARIIIEKNVQNYKTAEEAFYDEIKTLSPNFDKSLNSKIGYFKIDKFDAFGGEVVNKTQGTWVTRSNNYLAVIIKNNYVIKISDSYYDVMVDGKQSGDKPLVDEIISSIYFDTLHYWK